MLSRKQKKAYVKDGGVRCPFCQSQEIEARIGGLQELGLLPTVVVLTNKPN